MIRNWYVYAKQKLTHPWRKWVVIAGILIVFVIIIVQLLYPTTKLLPYTSIENIQLGGWSKADAVVRLDNTYKDTHLNIYFANAQDAYVAPKLGDIGLVASNESRIMQADYHWFERLIPGSILWAHTVIPIEKNPDYNRNIPAMSAYIINQFGASCKVKPKDAGLKAKGTQLSVVPASPGGVCDTRNVTTKLATVEPLIGNPNKVAISGNEVLAVIGDEKAKQLADELTKTLKDGIALHVGSATVTIPATDAFSWLDFSNNNGLLDYSYNADRAKAFLDARVAPKVAVSPGVTAVSTYDFAETSRVIGKSGQSIDIVKTLDAIKAFTTGAALDAIAVTQPIAPTLSYSRAYSPTDRGITALMQNYATSHPGTYGISMIELSGANRHAGYQSDTQFTTASTYKIFVAYSTLLRIESGEWRWSDQIEGGRDLTKCFDDMTVKSDNACATALLTKIGFNAITNEAHAIGATHTSFLGTNGIKSTSGDEALVLAQLQNGQILIQQSSRDIWINAMKRNIYRQGIPAGIRTVTVADKVGFLDALIHDAGIIYSPTGIYILVVMTNNASWVNIAELTSQIEALRSQ